MHCGYFLGCECGFVFFLFLFLFFVFFFRKYRKCNRVRCVCFRVVHYHFRRWSGLCTEMCLQKASYVDTLFICSVLVSDQSCYFSCKSFRPGVPYRNPDNAPLLRDYIHKNTGVSAPVVFSICDHLAECLSIYYHPDPILKWRHPGPVIYSPYRPVANGTGWHRSRRTKTSTCCPHLILYWFNYNLNCVFQIHALYLLALLFGVT